MRRPPTKPVGATTIEEQMFPVFPQDLNPAGVLFGGWIPFWGDWVAGTAAWRHCGIPVVTAVIDRMFLLVPAHVGDILIFKASLNRVWKSSCEIGIKVFVEDLRTRKLQHIASGYFVVVTAEKDEHGQRRWMPKVIPETEEEKRRYNEAGPRRRQRKRELKRFLAKLNRTINNQSAAS